MTTEPSVGARGTDACSSITAGECRHVLACTDRSPPPSAGRCLDVRPGAAAGYAGGRVTLPLLVRAAGRCVRIQWTNRTKLDTEVSAMLASDGADWVRFGDPASLRRLIGAPNAAALEDRLADTAAASEAPLLTWTRADPAEVDRAAYDLVVERATGEG